jgi:excinuclease ABC subunit C
LVVLDGGQGQLSAVADLLEPAKIPFIGRNKSGDHSKNAVVQIILPHGDGYSVTSIAQMSHVVKLLARIDDEAHRFAVSYHTVLKRKNQIKSVLDDIPGIGPKTRAKLKKLGGASKIKQMPEPDLAQYIGVAKAKLVKAVLQHH